MSYWSQRAEIPVTRLVAWLGIGSKYYGWKIRYGKLNEHNGKIPRDHWIEDGNGRRSSTSMIATNAEVADIDVPVLMGDRRQGEARALERSLDVPMIQSPSRPQHPVGRRCAHRYTTFHWQKGLGGSSRGREGRDSTRPASPPHNLSSDGARFLFSIRGRPHRRVRYRYQTKITFPLNQYRPSGPHVSCYPMSIESF